MQKIIVWTDVESAGTKSDIDPFLEVAVVFTDFQGKNVAEPYNSLVRIKNLNRIMREASPEVLNMHEKSGLWSDLWELPSKSSETIDKELLELTEQFEVGSLVFGGNSLFLDRRFSELYLPRFYNAISHRNVDVTTLSMVLQERFNVPMYRKRNKHRALADVWDSIDEYLYYAEHMERHPLENVDTIETRNRSKE